LYEEVVGGAGMGREGERKGKKAQVEGHLDWVVSCFRRAERGRIRCERGESCEVKPGIKPDPRESDKLHFAENRDQYHSSRRGKRVRGTAGGVSRGAGGKGKEKTCLSEKRGGEKEKSQKQDAMKDVRKSTGEGGGLLACTFE